MKRRHRMPFGAEWREDGSVRFRLWAPAANRVEVSLGDGRTSSYLSMQAADHGWHELVTRAAKPGTQYCFRINGDREVPDPASRFQPYDVHRASEVIDPGRFHWEDEAWHGRPWGEAIIYELHVGAFTPSGTFSGVSERLDYLAELGVTAIELMPVADFPGKRNWGYDGVYTFAPDSVYGRPDDLKHLVQEAHRRNLMVLLDVVYNHFGPEGNYVGAYAPQFFTGRHHTPWGNAINFDGSQGRPVRDFYIHNALYWLNEFHFDGLRLDAIHEIMDDSELDIFAELADKVRASIDPGRHVHLILENDLNQAKHLRRDAECRPKRYAAQWNDDIHHVLHVMITGEKDGYYADYSLKPAEKLARCLTEGFAYQGEVSAFRNGVVRGEQTTGLPPGAFISFLQNHDQVGNRAFGERIATLAGTPAVRAAAAIVLLAPSPPLLFMGEEFGSRTPFLFFCDFEKGLAEAVSAGRRNEFVRFARFADPESREGIPDPSDATTFESSRLDWDDIEQISHREWLGFYRRLIKLRCEHIVPRIADGCPVESTYQVIGATGLAVQWTLRDRSSLTLLANLGLDPLSGFELQTGSTIFACDETAADGLKNGTLPAWTVLWFLKS